MKNRDIPYLEDVLGVMQLVCAAERRLDWQRDRMLSISPHLTGMPGGGGLPQGLDEAFARLQESTDELEAALRRYLQELRKAEQILGGIRSRTMRAFVIMKYVMGLPDAAIRRDLCMTEYGFNRARRAIEDAENMDQVVWREKLIGIGEKET